MWQEPKSVLAPVGVPGVPSVNSRCRQKAAPPPLLGVRCEQFHVVSFLVPISYLSLGKFQSGSEPSKCHANNCLFSTSEKHKDAVEAHGEPRGPP